MKGTKFLTRTALLVALTLAIQYIRSFLSVPPLASNFIIGSLVNACLAAASVLVGAWSGIIISILAPVVALIQQHIVFPWLVPIIAGGNIIFVLVYCWWFNKNKGLSIALASGAKFILLFFLVKAAVKVLIVPQPAAGTLSLMFGWPQLVTAVAGGLLALPVIERLRGR